MNDRENKLNLDKQKNRDNKVPDSLLYPPSEDIYNQLKKESDIDPENISKNKVPVEIGNTGDFNEKDFNQDNSGADLDVPGAELDDQAEQIGSEDEENNYYSLGGDDHNDLDENTPDTI